MGKITYYVAASLDGLITGPDGDLSWLDDFAGDNEDYGYHKFLASVDTLVMGSHTYEQILAFGSWPYDDKSTHVMTKRDLPAAPGAQVAFHSGSAVELIKNIKRDSPGDIWLVGGGLLAYDFLAHGLLDELQLYVMPVILASGVRLFSGHGQDIRFDLKSTVLYETGVARLIYRPNPI